jgi:hypothetical protein
VADQSVVRISEHHSNGLACGWSIAQGTVVPYPIVFLAVALYQDLGLLQGLENLPVEQLILQLPDGLLWRVTLPTHLSASLRSTTLT